jgi:hypothetical protein
MIMSGLVEFLVDDDEERYFLIDFVFVVKK